MILCDREIEKAIKEERLVITPRPEPLDKKTKRYDSTSVNLCLDTKFYKPKEGAFSVDYHGGKKFPSLDEDPNYEKIPRSVGDPYVLRPHTFILGNTEETVCLPYNDTCCLAARVEGKSAYARQGLLVHFTAPTIHAGYNGVITLEFMNLGENSINLCPGDFICQLIVESVQGEPSEFYESQFQGSSDASGS